MSDEKNLPDCICGANRWEGRGGSWGSPFSQSAFRCGQCPVIGEELYYSRSALFVVNPTDQHREYINTVMMPVWRVAESVQKAAESERVRLFRPNVLKAAGLPADFKTEQVYELSEPVRKLWHAEWDKFHEAENELMRREVPMDPMPPKMPADMIAFIRRGRSWVRVNPAESAKLSVPIDPRRIRHEEYFNKAFKTVEAALQVKINPREVPNQYSRDPANSEPWYKFFIGPVEFTVGPRKRVTAVRMHSPLIFDATDLKRLASADNVTFDATGPLTREQRERARVIAGKRYGTPEDTLTQGLEIHAWTIDKLIEYLTVAGVLAKSLGRGPKPEHNILNSGFVHWPTHLHDDPQGGTVVMAVVEDSDKAWSQDPWRRAALVKPRNFGISEHELTNLVAYVALGTSNGSWWHDEPGGDNYRMWECTRDDLTSEGYRIVTELEQLYGRPVRLVTFIDT